MIISRKKIGLLNKKSHIIFIIISLSALIILNIANSITSLNRLELQNKIFETLRSYENFQDKTEKLLSDSSFEKTYTEWLYSEKVFTNNFKEMLELENKDIDIQIKNNHFKIYLSIINSSNTIKYHIYELKKYNPEVLLNAFKTKDVNTYLNSRINKTLNSINDLKIMISTLLNTNMEELYRFMILNQREATIKKSTYTIIATIIIIILMLLVLNISIKSNRKSEIEYLNKANKTLDVTLEVLAHQVELRDNMTREHLERTSNYVYEIAKELKKHKDYANQITSNYIRDLKRASVLHDIGKIAIPDKILHKKDKLTTEEFEIVKCHCKDGADTLRLAKKQLPFESFLDLAINLTESHHEFWDGSGYPNKLMGEDIPLSGRIMAIADVYDALRSKRIYKDKFGHKKCFNYIKDRSGIQFDPIIVSAFCRIEETIKLISIRYSDE